MPAMLWLVICISALARMLLILAKRHPSKLGPTEPGASRPGALLQLAQSLVLPFKLAAGPQEGVQIVDSARGRPVCRPGRHATLQMEAGDMHGMRWKSLRILRTRLITPMSECLHGRRRELPLHFARRFVSGELQYLEIDRDTIWLDLETDGNATLFVVLAKSHRIARHPAQAFLAWLPETGAILTVDQQQVCRLGGNHILGTSRQLRQDRCRRNKGTRQRQQDQFPSCRIHAPSDSDQSVFRWNPDSSPR